MHVKCENENNYFAEENLFMLVRLHLLMKVIDPSKLFNRKNDDSLFSTDILNIKTFQWIYELFSSFFMEFQISYIRDFSTLTSTNLFSTFEVCERGFLIELCKNSQQKQNYLNFLILGNLRSGFCVISFYLVSFICLTESNMKI